MTRLAKIIVPLDGGPEHQTAIAVAAQLAVRAEARVELLTVGSPGLLEYDDAELRDIADDASERFGDEIDTRTLADAGSIAEQLAAAAAEPGALLCMSSTARPAIVEAVTGSVSAEVIRRTTVPVVVVGPECAATWHGRLLLIAVDSPTNAIVTPATALAGVLGLDPQVQLIDDADALIALSRTADVAMIAMTTHGRRPLRRLAAPSLLQRVLRHAACPVLVETNSGD